MHGRDEPEERRDRDRQRGKERKIGKERNLDPIARSIDSIDDLEILERNFLPHATVGDHHDREHVVAFPRFSDSPTPSERSVIAILELLDLLTARIA